MLVDVNAFIRPLSQHPEFFSFGLFSKAGPSRKQVKCCQNIEYIQIFLFMNKKRKEDVFSVFCVMCVFRWRVHPSSLPSMERATQRDRTPRRGNLTARSAHWFRDQVTGLLYVPNRKQTPVSWGKVLYSTHSATTAYSKCRLCHISKT